MERAEIPNSVIGAVAEVLGSYYYSHTRLNTLFMEHGAPGDPPMGNYVTKCSAGLKRCNNDASIQPLEVLVASFKISWTGNSIPAIAWRENKSVSGVLLERTGFRIIKTAKYCKRALALPSEPLPTFFVVVTFLL